MLERLTWKQIQEKYPDQWVGLVDVKYVNDDNATIESAVVKYYDRTQDELTERMLNGEIISHHTNPDGHFQSGVILCQKD